MQHAETDLSFRLRHGNWIRLRTLILLRWAAIVGQVAAIAVAYRAFQIDLPLGLCAMAVGASVLANLVAMVAFPENRRLTEGEAMLVLLFDMAQLAVLLVLTGGLTNPFALLILAPTTIAATALRTGATLALGAATIALISLVGVLDLPLTRHSGEVINVPAVFEFGFWLAIVIGVVFQGLYARKVSSEIRAMTNALFATQMALAREQKLTDLGGVVAAAAHEMGTPLATIKLTSAELADELSDRPDLRDDALLIRNQADRCRDILRAMGQAGKDEQALRATPLSALLREAAEPHMARGKDVHFVIPADAQPIVLRYPETIHGLRNLIQNAVDFSRANVWVEARWTQQTITLLITDDGPGFPPQILGRIGDPFMRGRPADRPTEGRDVRPDYEGMGLGLFIAKTLLERTGAALSFANGEETGGASVTLIWPRTALEAQNLSFGSL